MLESIELSNFKCFRKLELNCAPLTLLCGMKGMGKSSVIQALLVLRQSCEAWRLREGRLVLACQPPLHVAPANHGPPTNAIYFMEPETSDSGAPAYRVP